MSRLKLTKKLHPAKKAWKSFSNTFQSKFHKINISKSIKTTLKLLLSTLHTLIHLIPYRKNRSLTTTRPYSSSYYHVQHKNFAAITIDDLFGEGSQVSMHDTNKSTTTTNFNNNNNNNHAQGETSRSKGVHGNKGLHGGESSDMATIEDAWKAVVAKSPQLQVDTKAEEFIYKFREDMRLQKEKSLLEFQEMLARST
ncbi:hypothetical protein TanjilG_25732 [Lupinus angustifolius]|uniref:DUF761 domain-containing protein n=1 Tax=Lupinus angustifolius TaxID=3871 RepID=A0A394DC47_LUPAN|nr:PREDICTED: uncharacterized protein LOC109339055 [Lupinus angustifolius]OIW20926.1 hypothetical protein TanjilG_25732 [Lupinus angustifolius]